MNKFIVTRFDHVKNDRTRETEYGYLYVHLLQDTVINGKKYESDRVIGIKIVAKNKAEAVKIFDTLIDKHEKN